MMTILEEVAGDSIKESWMQDRDGSREVLYRERATNDKSSQRRGF